MTIQTIKRNISKLLIVVLAAMLMIAFIPGDVQAGLENLANAGLTPDSWEDTIFDVDTHMVNQAPTWEEFTAPGNQYGYEVQLYVSLTDYVNSFTSNKYKGTKTVNDGDVSYVVNEYIVRIDNAEELYLFSQVTNPSTTVTQLASAMGGAFNNEDVMREFLGLHYVLGNNIDWNDMPGYKFNPIGKGADPSSSTSVDRPFTGTFDGQGFEISNLVFITDSASLAEDVYFGFFGCVGETGFVTMFGLYDPVINTSTQTGNMRVAGIAGKNYGRIEYVYVSAVNVTGYQVVSPVGVAGLVYQNYENAIFKNAYYTGQVVTDDSVMGPATAYPVYYSNKSDAENIEKLYYNRDKFQPTNNLPTIVTAAGYPKSSNSDDYNLFRDAFNAFAPVTTIAQSGINGCINGTTYISPVGEPGTTANLLDKFCQFLNVSADEIYSPPTRLRELIAGLDRTTLPITSFPSFRAAFNAYEPVTTTSQANLDNYINGVAPVISSLRAKFCDFLDLQDEDLDNAELIANAVKSKGYDVVVYSNLRAAFIAAEPEIDTTQGIFDAYIVGDLEMPEEFKNKLCSFLNVSWSAIDTPAKLQAVIDNGPPAYWPQYNGFVRLLNTTGPNTSFTLTMLDQFITGTMTISAGASGSTADHLGQICTALGVNYGDIYHNRNLDEPGEVRPMRNNEMLWRQWGLTDSAWRRHDYRAVYAAHTAEQFSLTTYPKLSGFTGDINPNTGLPIQTSGTTWGNTTTYPLTILTPADLVYFAKFISAGQNYRGGTSTLQAYVLNRTYFVGACIDMSSVAPDAYQFTAGDYTPGDFSQPFAGTFYGLAKGTEVCYTNQGGCDHYHYQTVTEDATVSDTITTPIATGTSHNIINLSITQEVFTTGLTIGAIPYIPQNSYALGFLPIVDGGTFENINFIGGLSSPSQYNERTTGSALYHVGSVHGIHNSGIIRNVHSSMPVVIPDGAGLPFVAGGLLGSTRTNFRFSSYSGFVSGGIHPYNPVYAPNSDPLANTASENRALYYTAGLVGLAQGIGSASGTTYRLSGMEYNINTATVEGAGFYNVPDGTDLAVYGVVTAGLVGENLHSAANIYSYISPPKFSINYGAVYALPRDAATGAIRTGPSGETVYALSPIVGGLQGLGTQPNYLYRTEEVYDYALLSAGEASLNYGTVTVENAKGTTWAAGIVGCARRGYYEGVDRFINLGDITVTNTEGILRIGGIYNCLTSGVVYNRNTHNYGNITVDCPDLSECYVGGVSNGTNYDATNLAVLNYGDIDVSVGADCTITRVSGVSVRTGSTSARWLNRSVHNYGNISVTSAQTTGELWVQGVSFGYTTLTNGTNDGGAYNSGDINVNATATGADTDIKIGGIFGYITVYRDAYNGMNQGDITVTADTSTALYVGGIAPTSSSTTATNLTMSLNGGDITVTNTGSGDVYAGGLAGYWEGFVRDGVNNGDVTAYSAGQNAYVGGVVGMTRTASALINNCLNYGNVTSVNSNPDAVTLYTSGIVGYYSASSTNTTARNCGLVNHGSISETHHASADTTDIMVGGVVARFRAVSTSARLNGWVNYGTVTGTTPHKAAIFTRTDSNLNGAVTFANRLNTDENVDMFAENGSTYASTTLTNAKKWVLLNLYTANANDSMLGDGTNSQRTITELFKGAVQYAPADDMPDDGSRPIGMFNEDFVLRNDTTNNNTIVYIEPLYVAPHLQTAFPQGLYAVVTSKISIDTVDSQIPFSLNAMDNQYLPDSMKLTGSYSMSPATHITADYVVTKYDAERGYYDAWLTQARADGGESAKTLYDNSKQVSFELTILEMSLQTTADDAYLGRPIISQIQGRGPEANTINFYYTEDLLGRVLQIRGYKLSEATADLMATDTGNPWQDARFVLPSAYDPAVNTDLDDFTVSETVWVYFEGTMIPFTVNFYFLPSPSVTLREIDQSQEGLYENLQAVTGYGLTSSLANQNRKNIQLYEPINYTADDLVLEADGTYVLQSPVYHYAARHDQGFFQLSLRAENLTEQFFLADYTKVYNETGDDMSHLFRLHRVYTDLRAPTSWSMRYTPRTGKYLSGTNVAATTPSTVSGIMISGWYEEALRYIPRGWYTMVTTVNGRDLIRIKFQIVDHDIGRVDSYRPGYYFEDFNTMTITRSNATFGCANYAWSLRSMSKTTNPTGTTSADVYLYNMESDKYYYSYKENGTTYYEHCGKYLYDVVYNADGSHTYKVKLGVWPNYAEKDWQYEPVTWWDVITHEASPDTVVCAYGGLSLNGTAVGDGSGTVVTLPKETRSNKVTIAGSYSECDFYSSPGLSTFTFDITYNGQPLTLKAGSSKTANLVYQLNGVDVIKGSYSISGNTNNNANAAFQWEIYANAPSGTYVVQPVYDRTVSPTFYDISVADFDTMTRAQVKTAVEATAYTQAVQWHSPLGEAITITKPNSNDSYLDAMNFPNMLSGGLECSRADHNHAVNPITFGRNGLIDYSNTLELTGDNRCDHFTYTLSLNEEDAVANYNPVFTPSEKNATLYLWDGAAWQPIDFNHTADYTLASASDTKTIQYKVVAHDGETETFYTVLVTSLKRNNRFMITAVGEGALAGKNLQRHLSSKGVDLLAVVKQWNGSAVANTTAGCFTGNNGMVLPYVFVRMTSGNYLIEASVPDDCYYYINFQDNKYTTGVEGVEGVLFNVARNDSDEVTQINIEIVIGLKENYVAPEPQPMRLQWSSANATADIILPAPRQTIIFEHSTTLLAPMDYGQYEYAISSRTINDFNQVYFNADIVIEEGVTIDGYLYTTGNIINNGRVNGALFAEGSISGTGTTSNGSTANYWP